MRVQAKSTVATTTPERGQNMKSGATSFLDLLMPASDQNESIQRGNSSFSGKDSDSANQDSKSAQKQTKDQAKTPVLSDIASLVVPVTIPAKEQDPVELPKSASPVAAVESGMNIGAATDLATTATNTTPVGQLPNSINFQAVADDQIGQVLKDSAPKKSELSVDGPVRQEAANSQVVANQDATPTKDAQPSSTDNTSLNVRDAAREAGAVATQIHPELQAQVPVAFTLPASKSRASVDSNSDVTELTAPNDRTIKASPKSDAGLSNQPVQTLSPIIQNLMNAQQLNDNSAQSGKGDRTESIRNLASAGNLKADSPAGKTDRKTSSSDAADADQQVSGNSTTPVQDSQSTPGPHVQASTSDASQAVLGVAVFHAAGNIAPSVHSDTVRGTESSHAGNEAVPAAHTPIEADATAATTAINTSHLIQTLHSSEMRVGLRTSEFGDISIRTAVSQQQMTTQISVDHKDLGNLISAHASVLESKLNSQYGLHASIEVNQSNSSFSTDRQQSQQQGQPSSNKSFVALSAHNEAVPDTTFTPVVPALDRTRLDIRA